jgi:hypothetical protein
MPKAFISYTSSDRALVQKLAKDLLDRGIGIFIDTWDIGPADSIIEKMEEGLNTSDFLLLAISAASLKSHWVRLELNSAQMRELDRKQITVIPLRLDESPVPTLLAQKRYIDFRSSYKTALNEVVAALLKRRPIQRSLIPVIVYSPPHGPSRVLSRDTFAFGGPADYIEAIQLPYGVPRVEIMLTSPADQTEELYYRFFGKYDADALRADASSAMKVTVHELTGWDVAQWKVIVDGVPDFASPEVRHLVTRICEAHNRQIQDILSDVNIEQEFFEQSPLSGNIAMPLFDRAAFLEAVKDSEDVKPYLSPAQLEAFANGMEKAMERAMGRETHIEGFFAAAFPMIILYCYLEVKYPAKAIEYSRYFMGDRKGENPLPLPELQMLEMLQFWVIMSQEALQGPWAEYRLEHLSPEDIGVLEAFFAEHGMAGLLQRHGGVLGMFRLIGKDSPEMYRLLLVALNGLRGG